METTEVVIIGGGATGAGLLWDLSLRGIPAMLLEKRDLANGATGRCHGLLHSGARYAVKDPEAAKECIAENTILKRIAPNAVHDVGGLFIKCRQDDPAFFERWQRACDEAGIAQSGLGADEALALEPNLTRDLLGAFTCPDAHVDVFQLTLSNIDAAVARGGLFRPYAEVTAIERGDKGVTGVRYKDSLTGEEGAVACRLVVNASGGWAQQVAAMAGVDVPVRCDKGSLLVFNHCLVGRVVNRCRQPGDADILVPAGPVSILGTSSETVAGPEGLVATEDEIDRLQRIGADIVPSLVEARILRVFSGVRPLYTPAGTGQAGGREVSRGFALLDHEVRDGVKGFLSIIGGKLTTYRLMAAVTADLVAAKLGIDAPCRTAETPLRGAADAIAAEKARRLLPPFAAAIAERRLGHHLGQVVSLIEADPACAEIICECEQVSLAEIRFVLGTANRVPVRSINDIGRRTRLGFGPCQGTFCGYKAMLAGYRHGGWTAEAAATDFGRYLDERWKGQAFVHKGKQPEQLHLSHDLFGLTYAFHDQSQD